MTLLPIVKYPSPLLGQQSAPVSAFDGTLQKLAADMFATLAGLHGVGLAAIQVGVPLRVFITDTGKGRERRRMVFVNPKIIQRAGEIESIEGCLSYPGYEGKVLRAAKVTIEAQDLAGKKFRVKGQALLGRVLQHENDHLDGIMFLDKLLPDTLAPVERPGTF